MLYITYSLTRDFPLMFSDYIESTGLIALLIGFCITIMGISSVLLGFLGLKLTIMCIKYNCKLIGKSHWKNG